MSNRQDRQPRNANGTNNKPEEQNNIAFQIKSFHRTFQTENEQAKKDNEINRNWNRRTAIAAIVYTFFTFPLLIAGVWSAIQATNAVDQASRAVTVAQTQASIARDTEQRQLMAYVGTSQHGVNNFGEPNEFIRVTRKNYGITPAIDIFMPPFQGSVIPADGPIIFPPIVCNPAPVAQNTFALFPTQDSDFEFRVFSQRFPKDDIERVRIGARRMILWGAVFFKDIFGEQHCTRYCWIFKGPSMGEKDVDLCLQHNDTH